MTSLDISAEKKLKLAKKAAIKRISGGIRNGGMHIHVGIPSDPLRA